MNNTEKSLETALSQLVQEFQENPYAFFTEADAVTRFHQLMKDDPILNRKVKSVDGFEIDLVHREYPTFFRFFESNPGEVSVDPKSRRGHYDIAVLNPHFVEEHLAYTVTNRNIKMIPTIKEPALEAVVEFKLYSIGWSKGRVRGVIAELEKLRISKQIPLRYLVVLIRHFSPSFASWKRNWPAVSYYVEGVSGIKSLFAVHWLALKPGSEVFRLGDWIT